MWNRARKLRAQGDAAGATAVLEGLCVREDATWSPLARLELARISLSDLHRPVDAIRHLDEFRTRWPGHALQPEAHELECDAHRKAGTPAPNCDH